MSTKATIFLTNDNEHCYYEQTMPHNEPGTDNFIGDTIVFEMSKNNIRIVANDEESLIIEIDPGTELYNFIEKIPRSR